MPAGGRAVVLSNGTSHLDSGCDGESAGATNDHHPRYKNGGTVRKRNHYRSKRTLPLLDLPWPNPLLPLRQPRIEQHDCSRLRAQIH